MFVAGAFGAIGMRLVPMLLADGWTVMGMTRSRQRAESMQGLGVAAVQADASDADSVRSAVCDFGPDLLMHQLTDLPRDLSKLDDRALERNAALRKHGTRNLVDAAEAAGVTRIIAQSIAFDYAPGRKPYRETDLLAGRLPSASPSSLGVISLEDQVTSSPIPSVILRYGRLYGPGTGSDRPWGPAAVHIDAAAHAAALCARIEVAGVYNIAERDGEVDTTCAEDQLGWNANWRPPVG
ncbi:NAD-dependent epimerase/dehydratase family protein [Tabrizicola sp.]|uniref:NAD-dependent epimerase/dehydratase family protein n=1 Tax=Tabrizicola sp. TaxID=2005166 RepID=UPI003F3D810A